MPKNWGETFAESFQRSYESSKDRAERLRAEKIAQAQSDRNYQLALLQEGRLSKAQDAENSLRAMQTKSAKAELAKASQEARDSLTAEGKGIKAALGKDAFNTYSKNNPDKNAVDAFKAWYQSNAQDLIDQGLTPQQIGAAFMDTWQKNRAVDTGTGGTGMAGLIGAGGLTALLAAKNAPAVRGLAQGISSVGQNVLSKAMPTLSKMPMAGAIGRAGLLGAGVGAGMVGGKAIGNYVADTMPQGINNQIGDYLLNAPKPIQDLVMMGADAQSKQALNSFRKFRGEMGR